MILSVNISPISLSSILIQPISLLLLSADLVSVHLVGHIPFKTSMHSAHASMFGDTTHYFCVLSLSEQPCIHLPIYAEAANMVVL